MNFRNLEKANNHEVEKWLIENIAEITNYQKSKIYSEEIVRWAPFKFYKERKHNPNFFERLSVIFFPIVWILLFLGLPFTYIINGSWGYGKSFNWILNWVDRIIK